MTVLVVDVSSHNPHPFDYAAVRNGGVGGAVVKLTEGADAAAYVNPYAAQDVAGFRAVGLPVAGYHFLHPTIPVADQLALLRAHLDHVAFVWVDSELVQGSWSSIAATTEAMCKAIQGAGIRAGLYSNLTFLGSMPGAPWGFPLWLADYGPAAPPRPCTMWQFTDAGAVSGIQGSVDLSHYYGTEAKLAALFAPLALRHVPQLTEEDTVWLDTDPNNGAAILVVPSLGGWYGLSEEKLAYYQGNGISEAKVKITLAVFNTLKKLG